MRTHSRCPFFLCFVLDVLARLLDLGRENFLCQARQEQSRVTQEDKCPDNSPVYTLLVENQRLRASQAGNFVPDHGRLGLFWRPASYEVLRCETCSAIRRIIRARSPPRLFPPHFGAYLNRRLHHTTLSDERACISNADSFLCLVLHYSRVPVAVYPHPAPYRDVVSSHLPSPTMADQPAPTAPCPGAGSPSVNPFKQRLKERRKQMGRARSSDEDEPEEDLGEGDGQTPRPLAKLLRSSHCSWWSHVQECGLYTSCSAEKSLCIQTTLS